MLIDLHIILLLKGLDNLEIVTLLLRDALISFKLILIISRGFQGLIILSLTTFLVLGAVEN